MMVKKEETSNKHLGEGGSNFLISINRRENQSWQGYIQWLDTGDKIHFRSELELMQLISEAVSMNANEDYKLRSWKEANRIQLAK